MEIATSVLSVLVGLGLAAAAGFRIFVPLLVLSLNAHFGWIPMNESWSWVGSWPAITVLAVATLSEILAYFIPLIDNLLDSVAVPMAGFAGTLLMAGSLVDIDPVYAWALAIIAGGGTAAAISGTTAITRGASTATTAGTGNFAVASSETAAASILSVFSIIWAPIAVVLVVVIFWFLRRTYLKIKRKFKQNANEVQEVGTYEP